MVRQNCTERVCLYFVASPLHYLAARTIAKTFEEGARQILVYYKKQAVESVVDSRMWDKVAYMPSPRHDPLAGPFGRLRRLKENLLTVSTLIGDAREIHIHSSEYDNETINYFVSYLPRRFSGSTVRFRILPDGVLNLSRHPLTLPKYLWHCMRKLRRLIAPELNYTCFSGDRIGSDANFVDRIYVLGGFLHKYDPSKTATLPPLASLPAQTFHSSDKKKALVIGQYLCDLGLISRSDMTQTSREIRDWLGSEGIGLVDYKPHPRDRSQELFEEGYRLLETKEPLESYMAGHSYDVVAGIYSTALFTAKQIYGDSARVVSFGMDRVSFKDKTKKQDILETMKSMGIELL